MAALQLQRKVPWCTLWEVRNSSAAQAASRQGAKAQACACVRTVLSSSSSLSEDEEFEGFVLDRLEAERFFFTESDPSRSRICKEHQYKRLRR
jgi:hypothetical protein